ncbi:MAG TPA: DUF5615 family PIN-like protein [Gemmataceae bacterium]|nr:DUF5615 family PIN-like protein [Gemmataceae bacterium]
MTRPVYFADQDFNDHILRGVRRLEPTVQFLRVREVGLEKADDSVILAYAAEKGMIVLSHDVNTMSTTAWGRVESGEPMHGLFLVPQRAPLRPVIESLILVSIGSEAEEWINQVRYLPL